MPKQGIPVRRRFSGKVYSYRTITGTKAKAKEIANTIRKAGKLARVVKVSGGYLVYAR